jgi:crotonobetainyl-CoA:carnitine CoA-transferase CaiB-like acyl-CoA transferase
MRRQGIVVTDPAWSADIYRCAGDDEWCVVESGSAGDAARIASVTNGQALDQWIADKSPVEAMQQLQAAGVAAGAMLRVTDLPTFPSLAARHVFREAGHPAIAGTFPVEGRPIVASNWPDPDERPAPLAGQHTREIAAQLLGLSGTEIDSFIAEGILEVEQAA